MSGTGARIAQIAGAGAFAVVGVLVAGAVVLGATGAAGDRGASAEPSLIHQTNSELALAAAQGYLDAIADNDADAALAFLSGDPLIGADGTALDLLSDDALGTMHSAYPMTDTKVSLGESSDDQTTFTVQASFRAGDEAIEMPLPVTVSGGVALVDADLARITPAGYGGIELRANGTPISDGGIYLAFPGVYDITIDQEDFVLGGSSGGEPLVATTDFAYVYSYEYEPVLTEEGLAAFRGAVRSATEACLAPTTLAAGCGLELPSDLNGYGYIHDGTVSRTISDEQWSEIDQMVPSRTGDSVLQQTGDWIGDVHVEAGWTDSWGSGRGEIGGAPWLYAPTVDFSDPALPVTWE
ncbi:hypothetical protein [Microbacterium indicum]|uniref:hypothetical protein n=1 Tax=Microbacterium indicum TaxID=358100 RepID=UPI0003FF92B0|nr:hypothetical protein [Microbacterium indicum]